MFSTIYFVLSFMAYLNLYMNCQCICAWQYVLCLICSLYIVWVSHSVISYVLLTYMSCEHVCMWSVYINVYGYIFCVLGRYSLKKLTSSKYNLMLDDSWAYLIRWLMWAVHLRPTQPSVYTKGALYPHQDARPLGRPLACFSTWLVLHKRTHVRPYMYERI